jgi:hypothetical protein
VPYEERDTWTVLDHDLTAVGDDLFYAGSDFGQIQGVELWTYRP